MKCEYQIRKKLNFTDYRNCRNDATVIVDGHHYCAIHDPVKLEQREIETQEKRNKKRNLKKALYYARLNLRNKK